MPSTATSPAPAEIRLADYAPPAFLVRTVDLDVAIAADAATVRSRLAVARNPAAKDRQAPLVLDGDELELVSLTVDGKAPGAHQASPERLVLPGIGDAALVEVVTRLDPARNTKLMGLFASKDGLFTQCEAEGFRRITYFPDRPDVMARYTTTIHADRARYPVLLSNGNLVAEGEEPGGRHWAKWEDPFPKPCYLFALVAARLEKLESTFRRCSGKEALLQVWVEPGKLDQAGHAMRALKLAMTWDEDVFGLELDLDRYMIVAVGDFNMGAMENKGLNIFNTAYVLARSDVATDDDHLGIDRVVAHEYFHNWTGNRVTCRDWFQLSLKEGLTVFRDQEFGADTHGRAIERIREVRRLRAAQFPEDSGPMAHPVRPETYIEISNFYTATVYEKGAEVVRMIHSLIGKERFRKGMDLYFARHDGQAVTVEDFVKAMADASGEDLGQFLRWYRQPGTPTVAVTGVHDAAAKTYTLSVRQSCRAVPNLPEPKPLHIPFAVGLVGVDGHDLALRLDGEQHAGATTRVLALREPNHVFRFHDVPAPPVPSLSRGFSAPVVVEHAYDEAALIHLMSHDSDPFNRWEAGHRLAVIVLLRAIEAIRAGRPAPDPAGFLRAFSRVIGDAPADPAFAAEAMALPSETYLAEQMAVADPDAIAAARIGLRRSIARTFRVELFGLYGAHATPGPYSPDAASAGRRALRNACLSYLMETPDDEVRALCQAQFTAAGNMTDAMAALVALANAEVPEREPALAAFFQRWRGEALVVDKWFAVQAFSRLPGTLAAVRRLLVHPAFDLRNPNRARALIGVFCSGNPLRFHAADGSGYAFCAEQVLALDALNPQIAARMARTLERWRKFDAQRQAATRQALERIRSAKPLSNDVFEVVTKALG